MIWPHLRNLWLFEIFIQGSFHHITCVAGKLFNFYEFFWSDICAASGWYCCKWPLQIVKKAASGRYFLEGIGRPDSRSNEALWQSLSDFGILEHFWKNLLRCKIQLFFNSCETNDETSKSKKDDFSNLNIECKCSSWKIWVCLFLIRKSQFQENLYINNLSGKY